MARSMLRLSALVLGTALAAACGSAETASTETPAPGCPELTLDTLVAPELPPDGASQCAPGLCNYQTQAGCGTDEACRPQFNATDVEVSPGCEPAGEGEAGTACDSSTTCGRGLYCAAGVCRKLCCGADWSACDEGESCIRNLNVRAGGEVIAAGVDLCFPVGTCDVFDPNSCADQPDRECKIVDAIGQVACAPKSDKDVGDACAPPDVCKQGLSCVGGFCVKLCRYEECGEPACGPDDGACVHFLRDPEGVGECTLGR
jgi:hypothetical protein